MTNNKITRKEFIRSLIRYGIIAALVVMVGYLILNRDVKTSAECSGTSACQGCSKAEICPGNK